MPAWVLDPDCRPDTCRFWSACAEGNVPGPMGETLDEVLPDGRRARLDGLLAQYVGTHNFCNFTEGMDADDPSSKRQMLSFAAKDVVVVEGVPHVRLEVVGQSFMLHQVG